MTGLTPGGAGIETLRLASAIGIRRIGLFHVKSKFSITQVLMGQGSRAISDEFELKSHLGVGMEHFGNQRHPTPLTVRYRGRRIAEFVEPLSRALETFHQKRFEVAAKIDFLNHAFGSDLAAQKNLSRIGVFSELAAMQHRRGVVFRFKIADQQLKIGDVLTVNIKPAVRRYWLLGFFWR